MKIPANEEEYLRTFRVLSSIQWAIDSYNDNHILFRKRNKDKNRYEDNEESENKSDTFRKSGFLKANKLLLYYFKFFNENE